MSEYRRFIAYFYEYIDGKKQGNAGFAKVELRNGLWRFFLRLTVGVCPAPPIQVYGFLREADHLLGLPLGTIRPVQQIAEEWAFRDDALIGEGKRRLEELSGIWIQSSDGRQFATAWDGEEVDAGRLLTEAEALETEASERETLETEAAEREALETEAAEREALETEASERETLETEASETEALKAGASEEERERGNEEAQDSEKSESVLQEPKEMPEVEAAEVQPEEDLPTEDERTETEADEAGPENTPIESANKMEDMPSEPEDALPVKAVKTESGIGVPPDEKERVEAEECEAEENGLEQNKASEAKPEESGTQENAVEQNEVCEAKPEESGTQENAVEQNEACEAKPEESETKEREAEENAVTGMTERGRAVIEELFQKRAAFQPFADSEIGSCVMILPCDIARLQQENWQVGRSSFLQHGFYQYRHLLLGRAGDGTYILGVPGIDNPQEEYMAQMFGFEQFRKSGSRDGGQTFGYWCRALRQK